MHNYYFTENTLYMSRAAFLHMLDDYRPEAWSEEVPVLDDLSEFIKDNKDCFERIEEDGARHISTSVLLVNHDMSLALLGKHKKFGAWVHFGGSMDGEKNAFKAVLKEVAEKTGINDAKIYGAKPIDVGRFRVLDKEIFGYTKEIFDVRFIVVAPEGTAENMSDKFDKGRWVNPGEATILAENDESLQRLIMKWAKAYRKHKEATES